MTDIYLDYNATTPLDPRVLDAMLPFFGPAFGNAASSHARGRSARAAVEKARAQVAGLLDVPDTAVVWTSGSTEGINTIIKGLPMDRDSNLVVSAGEHKAVLDAAESVARTHGCELRVAGLSQDGSVDYEHLETLIDSGTALVAIMSANNETGALNDVRAIAELVHDRGALFLSDITQQVGKIPLSLETLGLDFAVASGHKIYGPQGVGVLMAMTAGARRQVTPLIHGGGHERGMRSGTLNVAGAVGFGAAAELAGEAILADEMGHIGLLRDDLEMMLRSRVGPITIHAGSHRLPNTSNLRIHGVDADALIVNTPGVAFSSGSACTSAVPSPSHVLLAMGLSAREAEESIRLSIGRFTTPAEVASAVDRIEQGVARIRRLTA